MAELLVKRRLVKDTDCATALVREGLVRAAGAEIRDPWLPVSENDEIQVLDKKLAKKPYGWWRLRELQNRWAVFKAGQEALCFGLDAGQTDFLLENGITPYCVVFGNEKLKKGKTKQKIKIIEANPMRDDLRRKVGQSFDLVIIGLDVSIFNLFQIISKCAHFIPRGRIIAKVKTAAEDHFDDVKNTVAEMAKKSSLEVVDFLKPQYGRMILWVLLKRKTG